MRHLKAFPPAYLAVQFRGGWVIQCSHINKTEFLGTDRLWHREPAYCDPFPSAEAAGEKIEQLKEADNAL